MSIDAYRLFPSHHHCVTPAIDTFGKNDLKPSGKFTATVDSEILSIPIRIYNQYDTKTRYSIIKEKDIPLACLFSRHHNGYTREECLRTLLDNIEIKYYTIPYILKLAEEHVSELSEIIIDNIDKILVCTLQKFLDENPKWVDRLRQRSISYWNCYYRAKYKTLESYPGIRIFNMLVKIAGKNS